MTATVDPMRRILDLAQACLAEPDISADELAGRAHLSRFHFDRLVSAAAGEPPGALRRRVLLERSAYRLLSTDVTVLDVAVEAGYVSHEAFSRAFHRAYGRTPTAVRADPPLTFRDLELPAPSGVHFHPPGRLRLPAPRKETAMEVLEALVDHHVDSLTGLIDAAEELPEEQVDRSIEMSVEGIDDDMTLRSVLNAMVTQEEHWLAALRGEGWPDESDRSLTGLARRHALAGRDFRTLVRRTLEEETLADTFVDTTCEPPQTFTLGGMIAHVITFAAVRRTVAVGALWTAGVQRMELADPRAFVDGRGA